MLQEARFDDGEDSLRFVMTFPLLRLFILIESIRDLVFTLILSVDGSFFHVLSFLSICVSSFFPFIHPSLPFLLSCPASRPLHRMIPQFISVLILMFVLFMVYAVIGVWLFADEWSEVLQDEAPEGNFDTLSNAMLSLFQLLVGEVSPFFFPFRSGSLLLGLRRSLSHHFIFLFFFPLPQGWHELMYAGVLVKGGFGATWYFISFIIIVSMLFTNLFVGMVLNAFQQQLEVKEERKKASKIEKMLLRRRLRDMGED